MINTLLLEESQPWRQYLMTVLVGLGCEVFEATDESDALEMLVVLQKNGIALSCVFSNSLVLKNAVGHTIPVFPLPSPSPIFFQLQKCISDISI